MTVAGRLPSLNWVMVATVSAAARPARLGTADPATARPCVPWHAAQLAARLATPFWVMLGGAKEGGAGAGCWASAVQAPAAATSPARALAAALMVGSPSGVGRQR